MTITIESTSKVVELSGVQCRIWEGKTESGIEIHVYIPRLAVREGQGEWIYAQFEQELVEQRKPSPEIEAIPLRMIL